MLSIIARYGFCETLKNPAHELRYMTNGIDLHEAELFENNPPSLYLKFEIAHLGGRGLHQWGPVATLVQAMIFASVTAYWAIDIYN